MKKRTKMKQGWWVEVMDSVTFETLTNYYPRSRPQAARIAREARAEGYIAHVYKLDGTIGTLTVL